MVPRSFRGRIRGLSIFCGLQVRKELFFPYEELSARELELVYFQVRAIVYFSCDPLCDV